MDLWSRPISPGPIRTLASVSALELTAPSEPIASARRASATEIQCKSGSSLKPPGHGQQGRARANRPSDGKGYGQ